MLLRVTYTVFSLGSWGGVNRKKMSLKSSRLYYHTHTQKNVCNAYWYSTYMMTRLSCSTENKYILVLKHKVPNQSTQQAGCEFPPLSSYFSPLIPKRSDASCSELISRYRPQSLLANLNPHPCHLRNFIHSSQALTFTKKVTSSTAR